MSVLKVCIAWAIVFLLMVLTWLRKKKIRLFPSLCVTGGITFFALLAPVGKTLFVIHGFRITQEALWYGLYKSAVLVGMVFLSQLLVSYRIRLPGKIGTFLQAVFFWVERLSAQRISFTQGHFLAQIDTHLLTVWQNDCD